MTDDVLVLAERVRPMLRFLKGLLLQFESDALGNILKFVPAFFSLHVARRTSADNWKTVADASLSNPTFIEEKYKDRLDPLAKIARRMRYSRSMFCEASTICLSPPWLPRHDPRRGWARKGRSRRCGSIEQT
jgi:hypothetical protein